MKLFNIFITAILIPLTIGCSVSPKYTISPSWDKEQLATVHIYRSNTSYHKFNPEKPFFYIDGKEVASLGTGESISIKVLSGQRIITVKEPFLFYPSYVNGRLKLEIKSKKEYFIRYSKDLIVPLWASTLPVMVSKETLVKVKKKHYLKRE